MSQVQKLTTWALCKELRLNAKVEAELGHLVTSDEMLEAARRLEIARDANDIFDTLAGQTFGDQLVLLNRRLVALEGAKDDAKSAFVRGMDYAAYIAQHWTDQNGIAGSYCRDIADAIREKMK